MALHGDICVNGTRIGVWQARRAIPLVEDRDVYDYECYVSWRDPEGQIHHRALTVDHPHSSGAVSLAARVLAVASLLREPEHSSSLNDVPREEHG